MVQNPEAIARKYQIPYTELNGYRVEANIHTYMTIYEDAVSYVRKNPERFFRARPERSEGMGSPDPIKLTPHIVGDALIAGATEICTFRVGDWWVIGSDVDWLTNHQHDSVNTNLEIKLPVTRPDRFPKPVRSDQSTWEIKNRNRYKELFVRIVPLPEAGPNSMRAEILLTAFAEAVITVSGKTCLTIKGDVAKGAEIWRVMKSLPHLKRFVAFRPHSHQTGDLVT